MIYFDYAANTPVDEAVLAYFNEISRSYFGNANAAHELGREAAALLAKSTAQILDLLKLLDCQLIYTSGATESNNLAIKGIAHRNKNQGRHIISTYLEHSSVNGPLAVLADEGFEIDYVESEQDGRINLSQLSDLMRKDTILVSVCYVDSEAGVRQAVEDIAGIVAQYSACKLHVDATQAIGKTALSLSGADLISFAPHKFYGMTGIGGLIIKNNIQLETQIHGGLSTTPFRSGTPPLALSASMARALELVLTEFQNKFDNVSVINRKLRQFFDDYPRVKINSTTASVPHILSISIPGINTEKVKNELERSAIYLSTRSACCGPNTVSRPIYAITKDKKRAQATLRISLSHLTTFDEVDMLMSSFDACYKTLVI